MASTQNTAKDGKSPLSPQHAAVEGLVGIATKHVNDQLSVLTLRLVSALLDDVDMAADTRTIQQRIRAGNLLKANSYAFFHLASSCVEKALRKEVSNLLPKSVGKLDVSALTLELVPFEVMDNKVAFSAISRPFEVANADPLGTLNVRLGFLLGRDTLRLDQNPFRPEVFLMAINQAWSEFEPDKESHALMVPMLRPNLFIDLSPMYEALNLSLMSKGVLPSSADAHRERKSQMSGAAQQAKAAKQAQLQKRLHQFLDEDDEPLVPDLPGLSNMSPPRQQGGWRPSEQTNDPAWRAHTQAAQHGPAAHHGPAGNDNGWRASGGENFIDNVSHEVIEKLSKAAGRRPLMDFLGKVQHGQVDSGSHGHYTNNVVQLPKLKESLPKGSLSRGDEHTIDLLSKIFDTVFQDPSIPGEIRDLIRFLQVPVLKAALLDKEFFFQEAHPARRMIDLLSRMGWEQRKSPEDPLFQAMQRSVDRVGREFDQEMSVFSEAVTELEASIQAEEAVTETAISAPIAAALKQEKIIEATKSAKTAVAARVGSGDVIAVVETFLENKWTSVLTIAYTVEADKPGAVVNATKTMDDLIWSVKPKITHAQRKEFIIKLAPMLAALNKWLDLIKWQDADRLQFFAQLAEIHASIVRAPIEMSAERQLEVALEVAQQAAKRRLEKEQEKAAAPPEPEPTVDDAVLTVESMQRGMWLEFTQPDGSVRKVKLAWISPLRTLFIFATSTRQEAFSLSADKLTVALRDQQAKLIELNGVVGVALSQAMSQVAVNDPEMDVEESAVA